LGNRPPPRSLEGGFVGVPRQRRTRRWCAGRPGSPQRPSYRSTAVPSPSAEAAPPCSGCAPDGTWLFPCILDQLSQDLSRRAALRLHFGSALLGCKMCFVPACFCLPLVFRAGSDDTRLFPCIFASVIPDLERVSPVRPAVRADLCLQFATPYFSSPGNRTASTTQYSFGCSTIKHHLQP